MILFGTNHSFVAILGGKWVTALLEDCEDPHRWGESLDFMNTRWRFQSPIFEKALYNNHLRRREVAKDYIPNCQSKRKYCMVKKYEGTH